MLHAGQILENSISGARLLVCATAAETNGKMFQYEYFLKPHSPRLGEHFHLVQEERYEILAGRACYSLDGAEGEVSAGDMVSVPPNTRHINCWNNSDGELHMRVTISPSLDSEAYFETQFYLAQHGKANKWGEMNNLQIVVIANDTANETYVSGLPVGLQRILFRGIAAAGHMLGYRARYT